MFHIGFVTCEVFIAMSDKALRLTKAAKRSARQHIQHLAAANTKSSRYIKSVSWVIEMIALGCSDVAIGIGLIIITTGLKVYAMWPLLFYGGVFIAARWLILLMCPLLLQLTVPIVIIINALLVGFVVVVDAAISALDIVMTGLNDVIGVINDLDRVFTGHKLTDFSFPLVKWIKIPQITYSEFSNTIKALPPTCTKFDTMPKIMLFFMRYGLHDYTCPTVRFLWPAPTFYGILEALLSWTYYGDAMPNPSKAGANCVGSQSITVYDSICASMGIGYLFTEFFFPSIVVFIVAFAIGTGVIRLLRASLYTLYLATEVGLGVAVLFLDIVTF